MKHLTLLVIVFIMLIGNVRSQEWIQNLPQDKLESGTLTFTEIQKAFYDYWKPFNVENGYYDLDGEKVKAPYYKQFKRWEWYWESRVDPTTGEFPDKEELDNYYTALADNNKSQSGNWVTLGPSTSPGGYAGLGRVNCVTFVPNNSSEYYAGTASGGIWHTIDDGATWTNLNDNEAVLGVSDILVLPAVTGPDILYIATGDRDGGSLWSLGGGQSNDNNSVGVLKSIDGGATWTSTGLSFTVGQKRRVNRLLLDPNSANQTIYAATSNGVYKTTDGGVTWPQVSGSPALIDMEFEPNNFSTIYGSTDNWGTNYIYRSINSGANWTSVASYSSTRRIELAVSYNQTTWVYAIAASTGGGLNGIYQSTNSGASFTQVLNGSLSGNFMLNWSCNGTGSNNGQGGYDLCIAVDPNDANTLFIGGVNTWKSTDGGANWLINNHWTNSYGCGVPEVHADKHFFAYQNGTSTLFECNDGGLYKTSNGGTSWSHLSSGMAISQIYRMGISQTQVDEVIIGLQDNGTKARLSGTWNDVIGGDGFECIIDYTDVNTQYGALYYGDIYRTTNHWGWSTQLPVPGNGSGNAAWCTPYLIDPANNNTIYVGCSSVQKSSNQGSNWSTISASFGTELQNMAIAPSNTNYIYAATHSNIYRTTSGGGGSSTVWPNITNNLPTGSADITYIAVKDDDADHVWVSMGAYNTHGVYETTNGGTSWSNISTGLPSMPVMCVIQNKDYAGIELYAGTDAGIYVMRDGSSWQPFSTGLPNVVVAELEIYYASNPTDNKIYAASFGRGVWSSDLYSLYQLPVPDFTGAPTIGIPPLDVNFTDLSLNTITTWDWDFGDGQTSTMQNPINTYNTPGSYDVKLVVTGPGGSDSITKVGYITINYPPPACDFVADVTSGDAPLTVNFTDLSVDSVDTWSWDFGDGGSSIEENPQYVYTTPGIYSVSLTVTGPGGSDTHTKTDYIDVQWAAPVAEFSGFPTVGAPPLMVNFTDASTGQVATYDWNFGDGGTSVTQNPVHQYTGSGVYTVSLTVTGPGGNDTEVKTDYITVSNLPPTANFSGNPTSGFFPLMVNFTDLTSGAVNQWRWYFGDGGTSIVQDPAHTYTNSGNYTVSLKAIGPGGSDSIAKVNYITVLVGIEELNTDIMKVYPNPCSEYLMIDSKESVQSIAMADIIGNIVKDELIQCPAPCNYKINMTDLHQGIYFCRITMEDGRMVLIKILKK